MPYKPWLVWYLEYLSNLIVSLNHDTFYLFIVAEQLCNKFSYSLPYYRELLERNVKTQDSLDLPVAEEKQFYLLLLQSTYTKDSFHKCYINISSQKT